MRDRSRSVNAARKDRVGTNQSCGIRRFRLGHITIQKGIIVLSSMSRYNRSCKYEAFKATPWNKYRYV